MSIALLDAVIRLASAAVLSGLIGFEREFQRKPAGVRTHMLVGLGSALFAIVSELSFPAEDPSRIAAGVVTGVGFLGAGAIFREGQFVRGLTTAAGLWVVAGVGLAAGAGDIGLAAIATGVALAVLLVLGTVERVVGLRGERRSEVRVFVDDLEAVSAAMKVATRHDPNLQEVSFDTSEGEEQGCLTLRLDPKRADVVAAIIRSLDGVTRVEKAP